MSSAVSSPRNRLTFLVQGELFGCLVLPVTVFSLATAFDTLPGPLAWFSLAVVGFLLLQGAAFGLLKLKDLGDHGRRMAAAVAWFRRAKWLNLALLGLLGGLVAARGLQPTGQDFDFWTGLVLATLAALEQVNYYHWQLMHDTPQEWRDLLRRKRLKRGLLARELGRPRVR